MSLPTPPNGRRRDLKTLNKSKVCEQCIASCAHKDAQYVKFLTEAPSNSPPPIANVYEVRHLPVSDYVLIDHNEIEELPLEDSFDSESFPRTEEMLRPTQLEPPSCFQAQSGIGNKPSSKRRVYDPKRPLVRCKIKTDEEDKCVLKDKHIKKQRDEKVKRLDPLAFKLQALFDSQISFTMDDETKAFLKEAVSNIKVKHEVGQSATVCVEEISEAINKVQSSIPKFDEFTDAVHDGIGDVQAKVTTILWLCLAIGGLIKALSSKDKTIGLVCVAISTSAILIKNTILKDWICNLMASLQSKFDSTFRTEGPGDSAPIVQTMANLIFGVVVFATIGKLPGFSNFTGMSRTLMDFSRVKTGLNDLVEFICSVLEKTVNYVRSHYLGLDPLVFIGDNAPEVSAWTEDVVKFSNEYRKGEITITFSNSERIYALFMRGNALTAKWRPQKDSNQIRNAINAYMSIVKKMMIPFEQANLTGVGPRMSPLSIFIRGGTGVGKSFLTYPLVLELIARVLPTEQLEDFKKNQMGYIYSRQNEHKYWDGYTGQFCTLYDDFGQVRDSVGNMESEYMDVIRTCNMFPHICHMAGMESKGNTIYMSKMAVFTTNVNSIENAAQSVVSQEAVLRRFDMMYEVVPKPEYTTPETMNRPMGKRRLDMSKLDPLLGFNKDIYHFYELKNELPEGPPINYDEFVNRCEKKYKSKCADTDIYMEELTTIVDKVIDTRSKGKYAMQSGDPGSSRSMPDKVDPMPPQAVRDAIFSLPLEVPQDISAEDFMNINENPVKSVKMKDHLADFATVYNTHPPTKLQIERLEEARDEFEVFKCYSVMNLMFATSLALPYAFWQTYCKYSEDEMYAFLKRAWNLTVTRQKIAALVALGENNLTTEDVELLDYNKVMLETVMVTVAKNAFKKMAQHPLLTSILVGIPFLKVAWYFMGDSIKGLFAGKWPSMPSWRRTTPMESTPVFSQDAVIIEDPVEPVQVVPENGESGERSKTPYKTRKVRSTNPKLRKTDPPKQLVVEGGVDANADQILDAVLNHNFYYMCYPDNNSIIGYGTVLKGRIMMIPAHYQALFKHLKKSVLDERGHFLFLRQYGTEEDVRIPFDLIIDAKLSMAMRERDCCCFMLPPSFHLHKDITQYYVPNKYLDSVRILTIRLTLVTDDEKTHQISQSERLGGIVASHDNGSIHVKDVLTYGAATQNGDCGSLISLLDRSSGCAKLLGFHVAGNEVLSGIGTIITRDFIQKEILPRFEEGMVLQGPPLFDEQTLRRLDGFDIVKRVAVGVYNSPTTKIVRSQLYGEWKPALTKPAHLKSFVTWDNGVQHIRDPMAVALSKYRDAKDIRRVDFVGMAASHLYSTLINKDIYYDRYKPKVFDFDVAVKGIPGEQFLDSIPRNTSAGYPSVVRNPRRFSGKTYYFGTGEEYDLDSDACSELRKRVDNVIRQAKEGVRCEHVFMDVLKDERRKIEKVDQFKTRLVSASPIDYLIAVRMYFLDFSCWFMRNRISNGSAVGINVYSIEWDLLARHLQSKGPHVIAGDFSNFDGSEMPLVHVQILEIINAWYGGTEEENKIRRILWMEVYNSMHISGDYIYAWNHSLPSGHPLTTIINTMYNLIAFRYCWLCLQPVENPNLEDFNGAVYVVAYGDDNAVNIHEGVISWFNQHTITKAMSAMGLTYTSEDKESAVTASRTIREISFLKRSFSQEHENDTFIAPLELDVILEMPYWTKAGSWFQDIQWDNFCCALRELSLHEKEVFDEWAPKMLRACKTNLRKVPEVTNFYTLRSIALRWEAHW